MDILPPIETLSAPLIEETFYFVSRLDGQTWRLGGGSALALHLSHRSISEICLHFEKPLREEACDEDVAPDLIPNRYDSRVQLTELDGVVRLRMRHGIVVAQVVPCLTDGPIEDTVVAGRRVRVEPVVEAVAGLLGARWLQLQPKDVFDLSYAVVMAPREFERAIPFCAATLKPAIDVIDELLSDRGGYERQLQETVQPAISARSFMSADAAFMLAGTLRKRTSDMMIF